jgi:FkbM family methyltransferase
MNPGATPESPLGTPLVRAALLAARIALPGHQRLLRRAGVWDNPRWSGERPRTCRARWHRAPITLDLRDYHQRGAYFFARLMDLPLQVFLLRAIRPGDEILDLGANVGLVTLLAAHAAGATGHVVAVEPNPDVLPLLASHLAAAGCERRVTVIDAGFSDTPATLTLTVPPTGNTGAGTLGSLPPRHGGRTSATHKVRVVVGDDALVTSPRPWLIKLDVEGHETTALRGLARSIRDRRPAIITEVNAEMLTRSGSSAQELLDLLRSWGYQLFNPVALARPFNLPERLRLEPLPAHWLPTRTVNAVALVPGSEHARRLQGSIAEA